MPRYRRSFRTERGLEEHLRQSSRHRDAGGRDPTAEHSCPPCDRSFATKANLEAHLRSKIHQAKALPCIFGPSSTLQCKGQFVSLGAMILHLEGGKCASSVTSTALNTSVCRIDTTRLFTTEGALQIAVVEPDNSSKAINFVTEGGVFICGLCTRRFRTKSAVVRHLLSPRHQRAMYTCKSSSCKGVFRTLSGLAQHLESKKCENDDKMLGELRGILYKLSLEAVWD